ncbi:DUF3899 domain-containing protein [Mesomycoplasma hyorhinis]|uniref:DUF3899 domain-containing protein n=1 Tax=Mesomycoplasma hyorhinis TaxID=2100 RepID=UPI001C03FEBC|nr:DUF3899 domain-containing protein [Mesomycoplasma hyorhinis]
MSKEKVVSFFRKKILRDFNKASLFWIVFWTLVSIILYLVLVYVRKSTWYDAQSVVGFLLICMSTFATVLRFGFFNNYSKSYKNWRISSENKMRRENHLEELEFVNDDKLKSERKRKSLIPILLGFITGILLILITLPYLNFAK